MSRSSKIFLAVTLCLVVSTISANADLANESDASTGIVSISASPEVQQNRVVVISAGLGKEKVVEIFSANDGHLFIGIEDLLALGLIPIELGKLDQRELEGCSRCIDLSLVGEYSEDTEAAKATLLATAAFLPPKTYRLGQGGATKDIDIPYEYGPGFFLDYTVLGTNSQQDNDSFNRSNSGLALLNAANISLGETGIIRLGSLTLYNEGRAPQAFLADSYFEHQFIEEGYTYRIGDSRTASDGIIGASRVVGFHLFTNRELQPQFYRNPNFAYSFEARAPGLVEIYRDGSLVNSQKIDAGTVTLQDLPPSRNGDIRLRVRNVLGEEEVIYVPIFFDSRLIPDKKFEGSASIGALHGLDRYGSGVFNLQGGYGFLPWLSGVLTTELAPNRADVSGLLRYGTKAGIFQTGLTQRVEQSQRVSLARADWRYDSYINFTSLTAGASVLQFLQPNEVVAANAFVSFSKNQLGAQATVFNIGSTTGLTVGAGWGVGTVSVGALATVFNNANPQFGLRVSWNPSFGETRGRVGTSLLSDRETGLTRVINNAGVVRNRLSSDIFVGREFGGGAGSRTDYEGLASYDGESVLSAIDSAYVSGSTRTSIRASGSVIADGSGLFFVRPIYENAGYAVVDTGIAGASTTSNGQKFTANADGKMAFPVTAYRGYMPVLELPPGADPLLIASEAAPLKVLPGQKMRFDFGAQFGVLLLLPREGLLVTLNGVEVPSEGYYAQLDGLKVGDNVVRIDGREYQLPVTGPIYGVFKVDVAANQLVRESTE